MSNKPTCGAQLYVFHQHYAKQDSSLEHHLDEVLADVAAAGIDHVECWLRFVEPATFADRFGDERDHQKLAALLDGCPGDMADTVEDLASVAYVKTLLSKHSLGLCGMYSTAGNGVFHVPEDAEEVVGKTLAQARLARTIGCPIVVVDPAPKPEYKAKTEEELKVQAQYLNRLGEGLSELGMVLAIHNHTPSGLNNAREIRHNCDHTDPALVHLCLDTHWVHRAEADPFELLETYADRVASLHIRNSKNGVWMEEFGDGDLDYRRVAAWVEKTGFTGPLVIELAYEQKTDVTRSLRENLTRSREYVKEIFGI